MLITKSQVEQVIKLATKAHSFSNTGSSHAGEGLDEILNPSKDEKWNCRQELKEYLLGFEIKQILDMAQLMAFGRDWFRNRDIENFFTSIDEYENDYRHLTDKELAVHQMTEKKYLAEWLQEALKHYNPDNN